MLRTCTKGLERVKYRRDPPIEDTSEQRKAILQKHPSDKGKRQKTKKRNLPAKKKKKTATLVMKLHGALGFLDQICAWSLLAFIILHNYTLSLLWNQQRREQQWIKRNEILASVYTTDLKKISATSAAPL